MSAMDAPQHVWSVMLSPMSPTSIMLGTAKQRYGESNSNTRRIIRRDGLILLHQFDSIVVLLAVCFYVNFMAATKATNSSWLTTQKANRTLAVWQSDTISGGEFVYYVYTQVLPIYQDYVGSRRGQPALPPKDRGWPSIDHQSFHSLFCDIAEAR